MLSLREGNWRGHPLPPLGHDPQEKTLGILGMGGIGRNLKKKAEVFGMKTIYHNRTQLSEDLADGAEYVCFDELLARSDVLSLNLPLNVSAEIGFSNLKLRVNQSTYIDYLSRNIPDTSFPLLNLQR
jgi:glyoxylate reductase